jgi:ATP-dependent DNA helicase RecG
VVCPLIDDAGPSEARAVTAELARLESGPLRGVRLGLLHGQMPSREKEATMAAFRSGEVSVLVTTTVIEVGVDVSEATVVVVEDAGSFGLAQLHQLRGRVGRAGHVSWCFLVDWSASKEGAKRLEAMEETSDGFALAEIDLMIRGEGTLLGTRQKGRNDLRLASLVKDEDLIVAARRVAEDLVSCSPTLEAYPLLAEELRLFVDEADEEYLFKS